MALPRSEILPADGATWVRVTFEVGQFLDVGIETVARRAGEIIRERAPQVGAISISTPEVQGGTIVMDFRVTRTQSVGVLLDAFDGLNVLGGPFGLFGADVRTSDIRLVSQRELSSGDVPAERQRDLVEAEQARADRSTSVGDILGGIASGAKLLQGIVVAAVVGVVAFAAAPAIKTGATAAGQLLKKRRRRKGRRT